MTEFLQYWTALDYALLAVLLLAAGICLIIAIRAEAAIKRADEVRMTPEELIQHNQAMQRALKRWEQIEHEVHTCSLYLEWQAQGDRHG